MKAVLVIDMPKDCPYCPRAHWNKLDEFTGCDEVGGKKYAIIDEEYAKSSCRPSWCPLRPLPDTKDVGYPNEDYDVGFGDGWNACLKEITDHIGESTEKVGETE